MLFTFSSSNILLISYLYFDLSRPAKKAWLQKYYMKEVKYLSKRQTQLISKLLHNVTMLLSLNCFHGQYIANLP